MSMPQFPLLSESELGALGDMLYYMKMIELKKACQMLSLPEKGKKVALIERVLIFIKEGRIVTTPKIPSQSLAKNHSKQSLEPLSLMLYGFYKNDLKTRDFFKKLIGLHFHFTAFGIDWLNERWLQGKPPTYQEFADFWTAEMADRKKQKAKPKDEWMFIRFMQDMEKKEPDASQGDLIAAWKALQAQKAEEASILLKKAVKNLSGRFN